MKNQRKIIFNQKAFKCYRDKGFKEPYHENEVGWFDLNIKINDIKEETLYKKGLNCIKISFSHLPNGNWIASHDVFLDTPVRHPVLQFFQKNILQRMKLYKIK